ncbi:MAG: rhodanese-like domain-containing protein [Gammaproteobacteria bacterium]|nr:rhodanese-like domain-containing protein [Gammaproteobacteria bacterium]
MILNKSKTSFRHYLINIGCLLFVSVNSFAEENISPEYIDDVIMVGAEGVIELMAKNSDLVLVDSRIRGDRKKGYIESSVSLPDTETHCKSLLKIIPDKSQPALFYCNGVKCGRSAVAIKIAKSCGYQELYWFRGGFEVWLEKGFPFIKD